MTVISSKAHKTNSITKLLHKQQKITKRLIVEIYLAQLHAECCHLSAVKWNEVSWGLPRKKLNKASSSTQNGKNDQMAEKIERKTSYENGTKIDRYLEALGLATSA